MQSGPTIQTQLLHGLGDACLMIGDIADRLALSRGQISQAAALLIARGYVERIDRGCFQLTADGQAARARGEAIETGVTGPTRATRRPKRVAVRQRAWTAMRIKRTFTVPEITVAVVRSGDGDVQENLRRYFRELEQAGYLTRSLRRRRGSTPGSNGFAVWTLSRDTGPTAPVWSRKQCSVHDFNLEGTPCTRR